MKGFWKKKEKKVYLQGFHGSLSPVCFCCFGFKRQRKRENREREREKIQALEDIQTTNLFLVVEPLLVAVSA